MHVHKGAAHAGAVLHLTIGDTGDVEPTQSFDLSEDLHGAVDYRVQPGGGNGVSGSDEAGRIPEWQHPDLASTSELLGGCRWDIGLFVMRTTVHVVKNFSSECLGFCLIQ